MTELIRVENLKKHFPIRKGILRKVKAHVKAVDGVSFSIHEKETIGLVGESGCGKTTAGRSILKLLEPTDGFIEYRGEEITHLNKHQMRPLRKKLQIIFQDPYSSLNPRMTIGGIVGEEPVAKIAWSNFNCSLTPSGLSRLRVLESRKLPLA